MMTMNAIPFPSKLFPPKPSPLSLKTTTPILSTPNPAASTGHHPIDMSLNPNTGLYTPLQQKAVVLWDLDNKPPRGPPYDAALSLRRLAELFGRVLDISAYANRHAFQHLPQWVLHQRRQQRTLQVLERKGLSVPSDPYLCGVCGRKCRTQLDLRKHFRQLHEREREKKLARMRSLKGKKRQRYKERFVSGNFKYEEAARQLLTPKTGYGLAAELRRAGVFVKTVEDKPQAADSALKRQMQHSMARGVDWLFLVSDDSDFTDMIRRARESDLQTVVVGDGRTTLGQHADLWVPWMRVENGEVGEEEVLRSGRRRNVGWNGGEEDEEEEGSFFSASFYECSQVDDELEGMAEEIVDRNSAGFRGGKISAFSEEDVGDIFGSFGDLNSFREEEEDNYI